MSEASKPEPRCAQCGAVLPSNAPQGLCPKCLLVGVAAPTESGSAGSTHAAAPPALASVAAAFPQLEVLELIGTGGMGAVFKARQPKLNRLVALKILPEALARDPAFAGRFAREGQMLARLSHPNIVTVHDFGQANGFFYLLMEFVDGVNLRQAMRAGRFTPQQALAIVPRICEALQYAHDEGVLHRDIKPENILLDARGRVKLVDFGIAKLVGAGEPGAPSAATPDAGAALTQAGTALGTPSYMAPEQRAAPAAVDHRADIYSLGVVFYELLTGELPPGRFVPPSARSGADARVDAIVQQALEQERERRQQSARQLQTQVEAASASAPAVPTDRARPPEVSAAGNAPGAGRSAAVLAGAMGVVIFYLGFVFGVPLVSLFPTARDAGFLALVVLLAAGAAAVARWSWPHLQEARTDSGQRAWPMGGAVLGALGVAAWLLAIPVAGFALFFSYAMLGESGGWHPGLAEAVVVILSGLGALVLPVSGWILLGESRARSGRERGVRRGRGRGRRALFTLGVVLAVVVPLRLWVFRAYRVMTDAIAPELPAGSWVLVWKPARSFAPEDLVVYRRGGQNHCGRVHSANARSLMVARNAQAAIEVPREQVAGRVLLTWRASRVPPAPAEP